MKIIALVENVSKGDLKAKHGLSLYIETRAHKILFDLGPDGTLFENAQKKGIDLSLVDTVIISHGHVDHGGALKQFLEINSTAKIFVQRKAFEPHQTKLFFLKVNVGLKKELENHPQVVLLDGDYDLDANLKLFTVKDTKACYSDANNALLANGVKDDFSHEQNLIIHDTKTVLIMGCGHAGVVNVMNVASKYHPSICIGGYHLYNPISKKVVSSELLSKIAAKLNSYSSTMFYTCHCTGKVAFEILSDHLPNLKYLSCGESIEI